MGNPLFDSMNGNQKLSRPREGVNYILPLSMEEKTNDD